MDAVSARRVALARRSGSQREPSSQISNFKRWHEDAAGDGRLVLRIAGKRY